MQSLAYKPYRRAFRTPLRTAHGDWAMREGVILRLVRDDGTVGYGEVAPLAWFGTENVETALRFLALKRQEPDTPVPAELPCTRFALDAAAGLLDSAAAHTFHTAGLLPAGEKAPAVAESLLAGGYTTFKWKIGLEAQDVEQRVAMQLFRLLHERGILRLDANAALDRETTESWLHFLSDYPVEYLEQPMPPEAEDDLAVLAERYVVPIALDESIAGGRSLDEVARHFPHSPFILKPALLGPVNHYLNWRDRYPQQRVVYSSTFETAIGTESALRLAALDPHCAEAVGFGTFDAFEDDGLTLHKPGPTLAIGTVTDDHCEAIWKQL